MKSVHIRSRSALSLALAVLLMTIVVLMFIYPPASWLPLQHWGERLESAGGEGVMGFFIIGAVAASLGFPRQVLAFVAGLAYGALPGLALSLLTATSACYITVRLSQHFLEPWVARRFPAVVESLDRLLDRDVFIKVLVLRLQPMGTNMLSNVCIGFTRVSRHIFVLASAVGFIPQMLVFCMIGSGVRVGSSDHLWISIVLLLVSIALAAYVYRRHLKRKGGTVVELFEKN